ncbi:YcxB family protein [Bernardetia sp. Wsw4-3y2]|uniref:YcxB family protein n=1 Tax=unclassified Bernardetia TaxID=2647129 RepID=UPI0030CC231B
MKIEYTLQEEDFLEYQLYTTSKSESIRKKRLLSKFAVPALYVLLGVFFYFYDNNKNAILICIFLGALWLLIYPFYSKYRYKRFYLNHIKKKYTDRLDHVDALKLGNNNYFYIKEQGEEGKIKTSDISKLIELKEHFFLQTKKGGAIILPKTYILNIDGFKQKIADLEIDYVDDTAWKWN